MKALLEGVGWHWLWNPGSLDAVLWCLYIRYYIVSYFLSNKTEG